MSTAKAMNIKSSANELLAHRKALSDQKAIISELTKLIAEHEERVGALESADDVAATQVDMLRRKREDVLADIALGKKTDLDLKEVDREIDGVVSGFSASQNADEFGVFMRAEQSLEGLRRRKAGAEEELQRMEQVTPSLVKEFLTSEASATYSSYLMNAGKAVSDMKRIVALEALTREITGDKQTTFTGYWWMEALIPSFNLPVDGNIDAPDPADPLFRVAGFLNAAPGGVSDCDRSIEAERERLRNTGVFDLAL